MYFHPKLIAILIIVMLFVAITPSSADDPAEADLEIVLTGPTAVSYGEEVGYEALVQNLGPSDASNVTISFYINGTLLGSCGTSELKAGGDTWCKLTFYVTEKFWVDLSAGFTVYVDIEAESPPDPNIANNASSLVVSILPAPMMIDIKPGDWPNTINLKSKGRLSVAVISTADFDALTVDPATVNFAGAWPLTWHPEDVDGDGDMDLLFQFLTQELNLLPTSMDAVLNGKLLTGWPVQGTDTVNIVH